MGPNAKATSSSSSRISSKVASSPLMTFPMLTSSLLCPSFLFHITTRLLCTNLAPCISISEHLNTQCNTRIGIGIKHKPINTFMLLLPATTMQYELFVNLKLHPMKSYSRLFTYLKGIPSYYTNSYYYPCKLFFIIIKINLSIQVFHSDLCVICILQGILWSQTHFYNQKGCNVLCMLWPIPNYHCLYN